MSSHNTHTYTHRIIQNTEWYTNYTHTIHKCREVTVHFADHLLGLFNSLSATCLLAGTKSWGIFASTRLVVINSRCVVLKFSLRKEAPSEIFGLAWNHTLAGISISSFDSGAWSVWTSSIGLTHMFFPTGNLIKPWHLHFWFSRWTCSEIG